MAGFCRSKSRNEPSILSTIGALIFRCLEKYGCDGQALFRQVGLKPKPIDANANKNFHFSPKKRLATFQYNLFRSVMMNYIKFQSLNFVLVLLIGFSLNSSAFAQDLKHAGALAFSPQGVLFVGDNVGGPPSSKYHWGR